jgi:hypothetical protein
MRARKESTMSDFEVAFHKRWLGMLEPIEGLVVFIPVLVEAQCMEKRDADLSRQLADDYPLERRRRTDGLRPLWHVEFEIGG